MSLSFFATQKFPSSPISLIHPGVSLFKKSVFKKESVLEQCFGCLAFFYKHSTSRCYLLFGHLQQGTNSPCTFYNSHHVLSVLIMLTNIFYLGALTSFVVKPIAVTSPPPSFCHVTSKADENSQDGGLMGFI
jgi:hypothetical protein